MSSFFGQLASSLTTKFPFSSKNNPSSSSSSSSKKKKKESTTKNPTITMTETIRMTTTQPPPSSQERANDESVPPTTELREEEEYHGGFRSTEGSSDDINPTFSPSKPSNDDDDDNNINIYNDDGASSLLALTHTTANTNSLFGENINKQSIDQEEEICNTDMGDKGPVLEAEEAATAKDEANNGDSIEGKFSADNDDDKEPVPGEEEVATGTAATGKDQAGNDALLLSSTFEEKVTQGVPPPNSDPQQNSATPTTTIANSQQIVTTTTKEEAPEEDGPNQPNPVALAAPPLAMTGANATTSPATKSTPTGSGRKRKKKKKKSLSGRKKGTGKKGATPVLLEANDNDEEGNDKDEVDTPNSKARSTATYRNGDKVFLSPVNKGLGCSVSPDLVGKRAEVLDYNRVGSWMTVKLLDGSGKSVKIRKGDATRDSTMAGAVEVAAQSEELATQMRNKKKSGKKKDKDNSGNAGRRKTQISQSPDGIAAMKREREMKKLGDFNALPRNRNNIQSQSNNNNHGIQKRKRTRSEDQSNGGDDQQRQKYPIRRASLVNYESETSEDEEETESEDDESDRDYLSEEQVYKEPGESRRSPKRQRRSSQKETTTVEDSEELTSTTTPSTELVEMTSDEQLIIKRAMKRGSIPGPGSPGYKAYKNWTQLRRPSLNTTLKPQQTPHPNPSTPSAAPPIPLGLFRPKVERNLQTLYHLLRSHLAQGKIWEAMESCHSMLQSAYKDAEIGLPKLWLPPKTGQSVDYGYPIEVQMQELREKIAGMWCLYAHLFIQISDTDVFLSSGSIDNRFEGATRGLASLNSMEESLWDHAIAILASCTSCPFVGNQAAITLTLSRLRLRQRQGGIPRPYVTQAIGGSPQPMAIVRGTAVYYDRSASSKEHWESNLKHALNICQAGIDRSAPTPHYTTKASRPQKVSCEDRFGEIYLDIKSTTDQVASFLRNIQQPSTAAQVNAQGTSRAGPEGHPNSFLTILDLPRQLEKGLLKRKDAREGKEKDETQKRKRKSSSGLPYLFADRQSTRLMLLETNCLSRLEGSLKECSEDKNLQLVCDPERLRRDPENPLKHCKQVPCVDGVVWDDCLYFQSLTGVFVDPAVAKECWYIQEHPLSCTASFFRAGSYHPNANEADEEIDGFAAFPSEPVYSDVSFPCRKCSSLLASESDSASHAIKCRMHGCHRFQDTLQSAWEDISFKRKSGSLPVTDSPSPNPSKRRKKFVEVECVCRKCCGHDQLYKGMTCIGDLKCWNEQTGDTADFLMDGLLEKETEARHGGGHSDSPSLENDCEDEEVGFRDKGAPKDSTDVLSHQEPPDNNSFQVEETCLEDESTPQESADTEYHSNKNRFEEEGMALEEGGENQEADAPRESLVVQSSEEPKINIFEDNEMALEDEKVPQESTDDHPSREPPKKNNFKEEEIAFVGEDTAVESTDDQSKDAPKKTSFNEEEKGFEEKGVHQESMDIHSNQEPPKKNCLGDETAVEDKEVPQESTDGQSNQESMKTSLKGDEAPSTDKGPPQDSALDHLARSQKNASRNEEVASGDLAVQEEEPSIYNDSKGKKNCCGNEETVEDKEAPQESTDGQSNQESMKTSVKGDEAPSTDKGPPQDSALDHLARSQKNASRNEEVASGDLGVQEEEPSSYNDNKGKEPTPNPPPASRPNTRKKNQMFSLVNNEKQGKNEVYRGPPTNTLSGDRVWPEGWVMISKRRAKLEKGKVRVDNFWISPCNQTFRSMKTVETFLRQKSKGGTTKIKRKAVHRASTSLQQRLKGKEVSSKDEGVPQESNDKDYDLNQDSKNAPSNYRLKDSPSNKELHPTKESNDSVPMAIEDTQQEGSNSDNPKPAAKPSNKRQSKKGDKKSAGKRRKKEKSKRSITTNLNVEFDDEVGDGIAEDDATASNDLPQNTARNNIPQNIAGNNIRRGPRSDHNTPGVGVWTKEENEALVSGIKMYGKQWEEVAGVVKTRSANLCKARAQKVFGNMQKVQELYESHNAAKVADAKGAAKVADAKGQVESSSDNDCVVVNLTQEDGVSLAPAPAVATATAHATAHVAVQSPRKSMVSVEYPCRTCGQRSFPSEYERDEHESGCKGASGGGAVLVEQWPTLGASNASTHLRGTIQKPAAEGPTPRKFGTSLMSGRNVESPNGKTPGGRSPPPRKINNSNGSLPRHNGFMGDDAAPNPLPEKSTLVVN